MWAFSCRWHDRYAQAWQAACHDHHGLPPCLPRCLTPRLRWALVKPIPTRPHLKTRFQLWPPITIFASDSIGAGGSWEAGWARFHGSPRAYDDDGLGADAEHVDINMQQNKVGAVMSLAHCSGQQRAKQSGTCVGQRPLHA
jgi:hypothetical protein